MNGTARGRLQLAALFTTVFLGAACGSSGSGSPGTAGAGGNAGGGAGSGGGAGTTGAAGTAGTAGAAGIAGAAGTTGGAGSGGAGGAAGVAGTAGGAGSSGAGGAAGSGAAGQGGGGGHAVTDGGVDAAQTVCGTGTACGGDLSNVGTGNFCISFTLNTTQKQGETALLNQRSTCGYSNFWDIRASLPAADAGATASWIQFESDVDSTNDRLIGGPTQPLSTPLNDGKPHAILVKRVSGVVTVSVDGKSEAMGTVDTPLAALPALAQGTDVCVGADGTHALSGSIVAVCVTH